LGLVQAGVTGFPYDQFSSFGFGEFGVPDDTAKLRKQNHQWWAELQFEFKTEILRRSKNNEFTTGNWAVPIESWNHPSSKMEEDQIVKKVRDHADTKLLFDLGTDIIYNQFFPEYSAWASGIGGEKGEDGMIWQIWIDDSDGKVVINGIKLVEDMRQAGYPIPSDEWLINYSNNAEVDDSDDGTTEQDCIEDWDESKCCLGVSCTDMTCGSGCVVEGCDETCNVVCACG